MIQSARAWNISKFNSKYCGISYSFSYMFNGWFTNLQKYFLRIFSNTVKDAYGALRVVDSRPNVEIESVYFRKDRNGIQRKWFPSL